MFPNSVTSRTYSLNNTINPDKKRATIFSSTRIQSPKRDMSMNMNETKSYSLYLPKQSLA